MSVDKNIWVTITDGPFIPKNEADHYVKNPKYWTDDETKETSYDLKAMNILISSLSVKVYYFISHHKSVQTMWITLKTLYEGIGDIKYSNINMLIEEYELLLMEPEELVESMQTRFLHLINKLDKLGKTISKKDCANKILRYMCREWQPKVTTIKESNDLTSLDIIKLFRNLIEHENE